MNMQPMDAQPMDAQPMNTNMWPWLLAPPQNTPTLTARVPPMKSGWSVLMYSCSQATSSRIIF
jgi:hypothetical protein